MQKIKPMVLGGASVMMYFTKEPSKMETSVATEDSPMPLVFTTLENGKTTRDMVRGRKCLRMVKLMKGSGLMISSRDQVSFKGCKRFLKAHEKMKTTGCLWTASSDTDPPINNN